MIFEVMKDMRKLLLKGPKRQSQRMVFGGAQKAHPGIEVIRSRRYGCLHCNPLGFAVLCTPPYLMV